MGNGDILEKKRLSGDMKVTIAPTLISNRKTILRYENTNLILRKLKISR